MSKWKPDGYEELLSEALCKLNEEASTRDIAEVVEDALLEAIRPLLWQVYAQLCSYVIRLEPVSWCTASDDSLAKLRAILSIPDEEEHGNNKG